NADVWVQQGVQIVQPQNLALKYQSKVSGDGVSDFLHWQSTAEFILHGRDGLRRNPAGHNQVEEAKIGVYVQRDAVGGDSARNMDTKGGTFGRSSTRLLSLRLSRTGEGARPYVGRGDMGVLARRHSSYPRDLLCRDSTLRTGANQHFLQSA